MPMSLLQRRCSKASSEQTNSSGIDYHSQQHKQRGAIVDSCCCTSSGRREEYAISSRAVCRARILFIVCLSLVAIILGYTAHHFITQAETELGETQFDSIVDRAFTEAYKNAKQKRWATITMSSIISEMFPNASTWPFVTVNHFERIATNLGAMLSNELMGIAPIVQPGQELAKFEDFIYDFYENQRDPPLPNGTAVFDFGKGVYAMDPPQNGVPYHDYGNSTSYYGSPNQILTPISQISNGTRKILMFNLHSEKTRGEAIDNMIRCSEERASTRKHDMEDVNCGVITDMLHYWPDPVRGPMAVIFTPIYPANDPSTLVGFIASPIIWDRILQNLFADEVSGIDCVLETDTQVFTFSVTGGVTHPRGYGDLHQTKFDAYRRSIQLTKEGVYTEQSPIFTLSLYPNEQLGQVYSTSNPAIATIGAVCIIAFTSFMFFVYDFSVRREFLAKKELLSAKRKFMRFVSHEVRTPLNAVSMGLTVIQADMARSLGFDSAVELSQVEEDNGDQELQLAPRDKYVLDQEVLEWFKLSRDIVHNTMSAVDVLSDVLNYDKIESGSLTLELSRIPIWQVLEETVQEFKLAATKKKINLCHAFVTTEGSSDDESPANMSSATALPQEMRESKVIGDTVRLTQVIRNLVSNALKFTPEKGSVTVEATYHPDNKESSREPTRFDLKSNGGEVSLYRSGLMKVRVQDTGAGMSKAELASLFREGIQFNANELQHGQGSGFGLFIAKGIVEMHGGTLCAESEGLEKGTTFTMTLPLYHSPDPTVCEDDSVKVSAHTSNATCDLLLPRSEFSALNVLVVDDALSNRKLLGRLLKNSGHSVDLAEDGQVALRMFTESMSLSGHRYDTVLLDYEMPIMNGPTTAKEIRRAGSDVFIVGITGNMLPEDVSFFLSCGANAVLPKPFKMSELEDLWVEHAIVCNSTNDVLDVKGNAEKKMID